MLSALLGAICAASMAFAPMLVEPSSNISNNDGDFTSVHGAYYDASSVAGYGTTQNGLYNYTSYYMVDGETDGNLGDPPTTFSYGEYETATGFNGTNLELGDYQMMDVYFFSSIPSNGMCVDMSSALRFDFYLNGVYQTTLEPSLTDDDVYSFRIPSTLFTVGSYGWIFDLYEAPAYEFGTDTVADIAEGLTGGIGTVATGIGGGLGSLMQNIFLVGTVDDETGAFTATGLSTFGIVTVVFCGLALALGLSRWVVGFASSLGSRNR